MTRRIFCLRHLVLFSLLLSFQPVSAAVSDQDFMRYLEQTPPGFAQFLQQVQQHPGFEEKHLGLAIEMTALLNNRIQMLQTAFESNHAEVHPPLRVHVFPSSVFNAYCVADDTQNSAYIAISSGMLLGLMELASSSQETEYKADVLPSGFSEQISRVAQSIVNQDLPVVSSYETWTEDHQARQRFDSLLLFILAHETAHYYAGHLQTLDQDSETVLRKEAEADQLAFVHLKTLAHQNLFWPGSLIPVFYLFEALDHSAQTGAPSPERQHPPAAQRLNAAHKIMGALLYQPLVRGKPVT